MLKRVWQIFILFLIIFFLVLLQFSLISALPDPWRQINLVLAVLVFTLFFLDFRIALNSVLISGFLFDLFSFHFFGFYILVLFGTLLLAQWILKNWLTNRSLYTLLVLMLVLTIFYNFLFALILYLISSDHNTFFLIRQSFWLNLIYQGAWNLLFALLFFNLATLVSRRIKPFFLEKKSLYDTIK